MDSFKKDLELALRSLRREPGFAFVAIFTLALGIGINVALFSTVYGVLLRPLPYPQPDRLTAVWARWASQNIPRVSHTGGDFLEYQRQARSFSGLAAVGSVRQNLTGTDQPVQVQIGWVSRNFFSVLGVQPALGRDFTPQEGPTSVLLSDEAWHRYFGGRRDVLGRAVLLDGRPFTVVGILPPGFKLLLAADVGISTDIDLWKPPDEVKAPDRWVTSELTLSSLRVLGRLKPGVTVAQAQAEMDGIAQTLRARYPDHAGVGYRLSVQPLHKEVVGHVETALLILQGAVALVLLISCLNVANLLLVRAQHRQRETALRLVLGGNTARIARQMFTECLVFALLGSALGLFLAQLGIRLLLALKPANLPRLEGIGLSGPVLLFALGAVTVATLASGLAPVLRIRHWNLNRVLKEQSNQARGGETRSSQLLIVVEVALSLVLLLGAGLLLRSFARLQEVRPGFEPRNLLTFSISLPGVRYKAPVQTAEFLARLERSLSRLPGVTAVSSVWPLPLEGQIWYGPYRSPDNPPKGNTQPLADDRVITPGYLKTIGARLLEGRLLDDRDENVVLVDKTMAERNWPGRSALGRTIYTAPVDKELPFKVVGVVENIRHQDLKADGRETLYLPARGWSWADYEACLVVRTAIAPLNLVGPIRQELRQLDPQIPMAKVRPMTEYVGDALAANRFALVMMLVFSLLAVALAAVGLYGVVAYSLDRKTREIGIRMALGAQRPVIFLQALREGMLPTLVGLGVGILGSLGLTRLVSNLLFGVGVHDPLTYVSVAGFLVAMALLACYVPAYRAVHLDPTIAIREG